MLAARLNSQVQPARRGVKSRGKGKALGAKATHRLQGRDSGPQQNQAPAKQQLLFTPLWK